MKSLYKIILLFFISFTFFNCTKEDEIPMDVEINDFIWKGLNAYYLYQDQIPDLSDRRFNSQPELNNYLRGFSPTNLFTSLLFDRPNTDNKSVLLADFNTIRVPDPRISYTHGMEFGIIAEPGSPTNVLGYVQYLLPNSDASTKAIARGDFFFAVDTVQLTRDNYRSLLFNNLDTLKLKMAIFDGVKVEEDSIRTSTDTIARKVVLTKNIYTHLPVFMSKNFTIGSNNIGYLVYNNDFSTNYIDDLNAAFLQFKNQNTNQLILDLRYNVGGGSFDKTITQIASMITGQFPDQPLIKERWNVKAQPWFELYQPDSLITKFPTTINSTTPINSLQLTDVTIILDGSSSSIELLINSLSTFINVHVVNSRNTNGNNTGAITLYNSIDYDSIGKSLNHNFALQPIVLEFLNTDDQTYDTGINPEIRTCFNEDVLNLGVLGETSDPLLNRVLNFISTGNTGGLLICNPNNFEYLYNSVRAQQIFDSGVFIKQNLPNTN